MSDLILAIDQGTTGSTAALIDAQLRVVGTVNQEFPQIYPKPGWVEHDPEAIWASVSAVVRKVIDTHDVDVSRIRAIGITNQRETTVCWNRNTGRPLHNAIVWQCRRTRDMCAALKEKGLEPLFKERTGLVLDPYFSGTKMRWIMDAVPAAREDDAAFGTIDSYLVWRLTGGAEHVTDVSNASRTLLMNLATGAWDDELIGHLGVNRGALPRIAGNAEVYGHTRGLDFLPDGIPISGMAGDQQSALFGQACFEPGEAKCTYGTGAFLLMNTGNEIVHSRHGLLTTAAWKLGDTTTYALEGSAFIAGAVVQWLRDELGFFRSAAEIESMAKSVPDTGGVVLVPAFAGLGAPHWNPDARGVIYGITRGTSKAHIARAALEGIAFQCRDILDAMQSDHGAPLAVVRVDGGAAANDTLMQFQCDLLDTEISRPENIETTALGAAMLAALGAGIFSDLDGIRAAWREERRFVSTMTDEERESHMARWRTGLARV